MKKLILIFVVPFLLGGKFTLPRTSKFNHFSIVSPFATKSGVITMEDVLLHVILDNPTDKITKVVIQSHSSGLSVEKNGCDNFNCTYDLDYLEEGFYEVRVTTEEGSQFEKTIYLN